MKDKIITFICAIVLMSCVTYLGVYHLKTGQTQKEYDKLASMIGTQGTPTSTPDSSGAIKPVTEAPVVTAAPDENKVTGSLDQLPNTSDVTPTTEPSPTPTPYVEPEILEKYQALYDLNPDFIGWLSIGGTVIDYPVMFRDNEFYLRRDFYGESATAGCLFIDEKCTILPERSTNIMIYGHNMRAGTMFADLNKYREEEFWQTHRYLRFDTIYEEATYEIVAVFEGQVYRTTDRVFKFYQFVNAENQMEFLEYAENIKKDQMYETGVELTYGDELLTLITCSNHMEDKLGRLVVVAKKVKLD